MALRQPRKARQPVEQNDVGLAHAVCETRHRSQQELDPGDRADARGQGRRAGCRRCRAPRWKGRCAFAAQTEGLQDRAALSSFQLPASSYQLWLIADSWTLVLQSRVLPLVGILIVV